MGSSKASSISIPSPLPSPVSPTSLSMETPSLGSHDILPPPKRGAPPVPSAAMLKKMKEEEEKKKKENPALENPALCEGW